MAVFMGTTTELLKYTNETDLLTDGELDRVYLPSFHDPSPQKIFYSKGLRTTIDPFITLATIGVLLQPTTEILHLSHYDKSIPYGRPLHNNNI